ncbi:FAD-dependent urate hydroxylase [Quillaja saponaria]|uniref:FAD-dependent urate hydroxylase n=1 Tax=Quillaja saponaria TaxID=32244 RepID=A0AAD7QLC0_QUISA|nr:FAD-dependent urate hydroxylase [Quillaja saponaria]
MEGAEEIDIVIVGGGICGLATTLALHRKGIPSVVLERSECLRAIGGGITMRNNGWIALDQLGVASKLRQTSLLIQGAQDIWLHSGKQREFGYGESETRCLKRSKLIGTLAESLPLGTLRFGCHVVSIQLDPLTSYAIVQLNNGSTITSKILIGCDGANSVVADFLGLKPAKPSSIWEVRGFTNYPNGHTFGNQFVPVHGDCDIMGRIPIHHKLVYWFVTQKREFQGSKASKDPKEIKNMTLESIKDFPRDIVDMGGSAGLEDAVVLARCLERKLSKTFKQTSGRQNMVKEVEDALDEYVKSRKMRLL